MVFHMKLNGIVAKVYYCLGYRKRKQCNLVFVSLLEQEIPGRGGKAQARVERGKTTHQVTAGGR